MARFSSPLNNIKIASPCSANWDEMYGSERARLCGSCNMNVYNLSSMTKDEAERLIMNAEGRLCVRMYKRADGTVITQDCPVGWKAAKQRVGKVFSAAAGLLFTFLAGIGIVSLTSTRPGAVAGKITVEKPESLPPVGNSGPEDFAVMGDISFSEEDKFVVGRTSTLDHD